ncbi:MAG TPA: SET domain-containing protein-lysine N-methyltransferase [Candidatus Saccharimonadales bacterium]|nr:SET domain-containing protein-lysine N-methyltransferase [Candidatus Saccharimonadales bacterium]
MVLGSYLAPSVERREGAASGGVGLFAAEPVMAGELLAIKGGQLVDEATIMANADIIQGAHQQVAPDLFMAGLSPEETESTLVGYNHSCEPNAFIDGQIVLRAMDDIPEDEEVTVEYATCFDSDTQAFQCECNSDQCRGYVNPMMDSLDPDMRTRYAGRFAHFLAHPEMYAGVDLRPTDANSPVSSWITTKAERIVDSDIEGVGLTSVAKIRKGELLAVKGGRLLPAKQVFATHEKPHSEAQIREDLFMAGITREERMAALLGFNHRCYDPNSIMLRQINIFALRDIGPGVELTEDYATAFTSPTQKFPCNCGGAHCRGEVDPTVDWQRPDLRAQLPFLDFITEKRDAPELEQLAA